MDFSYKIKKLTKQNWLNLFEVLYKKDNQPERSWIVASRKQRPITDAAVADAVVIVPLINTPQGKRLVMTKEFRVPIGDYEYGFPAGLIDDGESVEQTVRRELREETGLDVIKIDHISMPVYSTAGMSDESNYMVIVEAGGEISAQFVEETEDIEVKVFSIEDVKELLNSNEKVAAKAWGLLYHYAKNGSFD